MRSDQETQNDKPTFGDKFDEVAWATLLFFGCLFIVVFVLIRSIITLIIEEGQRLFSLRKIRETARALKKR